MVTEEFNHTCQTEKDIAQVWLCLYRRDLSAILANSLIRIFFVVSWHFASSGIPDFNRKIELDIFVI